MLFRIAAGCTAWSSYTHPTHPTTTAVFVAEFEFVHWRFLTRSIHLHTIVGNPTTLIWFCLFLPIFEGDIEARDKGSLIAHESGVATPFGIAGAQSRGVMMVSAKDEIYRDMIIGLHQRPGDLRVNICKVRVSQV